MMKILFPVMHYPPVIGGIEVWTKEIAQGLAKKGCAVFVLTGRVVDVPNKEERENLKVARTSFFVLKNLSHSPIFYTLFLWPILFWQSYFLIKKEKIDILFCSGFLSGLLGHCLKRVLGLPFIITVQSQQKKLFWKKFVYSRADYCVASSQDIANYFKKIGVKRIEILPNGIDLTRFQNQDRQKAREELGLQENDFAIMTVARLEKVKGIEYLIKALHILVSNYQLPTINYQLIIVGDGSERRMLEKMVASLGIQERVKFLGAVDNSRVPYYLSAGDCFCLPSLQEGFGIVVLEAMAAGLPVIASKVGGLLDIVQDNENGLLVEPGNSQAISQAIEKIRDNSELARQLTNKAKQDLAKYDWSAICQKVLDICMEEMKT